MYKNRANFTILSSSHPDDDGNTPFYYASEFINDSLTLGEVRLDYFPRINTIQKPINIATFDLSA